MERHNGADQCGQNATIYLENKTGDRGYVCLHMPSLSPEGNNLATMTKYIIIYLKTTTRPGTVAHACSSQHFGGPRWVDHLGSGIQDQPSQHGKTPSLLKVQKLPSHGDAQPVIPATQEVKAGKSLEPEGGGGSELRIRHCTPTWVTERDSISKINK